MEAIRKVNDEPVSTRNGAASGKVVASTFGGPLRAPVFSEQPLAHRPLTLMKMPDEVLDYYAFLFCQRGFHGLGMTFEQFLEVIDAVRPGGLRSSYECH
jgi:hypothetical protein